MNKIGIRELRANLKVLGEVKEPFEIVLRGKVIGVYTPMCTHGNELCVHKVEKDRSCVHKKDEMCTQVIKNTIEAKESVKVTAKKKGLEVGELCRHRLLICGICHA